jgi:hypothetical protein
MAVPRVVLCHHMQPGTDIYRLQRRGRPGCQYIVENMTGSNAFINLRWNAMVSYFSRQIESTQ